MVKTWLLVLTMCGQPQYVIEFDYHTQIEMGKFSMAPAEILNNIKLPNGQKLIINGTFELTEVDKDRKCL